MMLMMRPHKNLTYHVKKHGKRKSHPDHWDDFLRCEIKSRQKRRYV